MPGWQQFYETHRDQGFEIVSVAMEHTGREAARPYVERAQTTFPTVVDEQGVTPQVFGFKAVPNGVLIDADGTIRWTKFGGFSIDRPEDVAAVEDFLSGRDIQSPVGQEPPYQLERAERELVATKLRLGQLLHSQGRRDEAVQEWREALQRDPASLVIRKQIWAALYPNKFHPTIDWDWQRVQLAREREEEIAAGVCGPDGCPIPTT